MPPAFAADALVRSDTVAREGPASYHPGVALLKRNERVTVLDERDGWNEVRLGDGRSGYVRSSELTAVSAPDVAATSAAAAAAIATPVASGVAPDLATLRSDLEKLGAQQTALLETLRADVARLHEVADVLAASPQGAVHDEEPWKRADVLAASGVALAAGFALGALSQRRRSRRERTLRF